LSWSGCGTQSFSERELDLFILVVRVAVFCNFFAAKKVVEKIINNKVLQLKYSH
jgi:hypothetical protein